MKNAATIRMNAGEWSVTVRGADGEPIKFNMLAMDKNARRTFTKEFVMAFRESRRAS